MPNQLDRLKTALADRYTVEHEIGSGGMATVYLAHDVRHDRQVAVKVLRPDLAATLGPERFHREIKIAAQLQHPHILPLLDSGEADNFLYYVMPYVEGQSLRDKLVKEGELPIAEAVRILRDVVDALTEAHAHGVVHRDIKPENVLLRGRHALVTDFGVAKAVSDATGRAKLTTAGVALGTPAYMAPEQASADPHLDQRVDIYAVGAMAYELLTGRPVFMGTTAQQVLSAHMTEAPQPVTTRREMVPAALDAAVMRCLEKRPADRFQNAEELLSQLEALATPSGGMTPTDTRPLPATPTRKHWFVPATIGIAALVIVVAIVGVPLLRPPPITVTASNLRAVTSEPGTERHPALSPDGSQVAFVATRDGRQAVVIKSTRGVVGGEARPTGDLGALQDWLPVWSPDGQSIRFAACTSGQCTWMETDRLGGAVRPITLPRPDSWAAWSPDGSRIAFLGLAILGSSDWRDSLFMYSIADDSTTLLGVLPVGQHHSLVWSPDGRRIAAVRGCGICNVFWFQLGLSTIWIVDVETGEFVPVADADAMNSSPVWLDDEHLLFVSDRDGPRDLFVIAVGPNGARGVPAKVPGVTDAHTISYSIAGRALAFTKTTVRQNVWSYPLDSGTVSVRDGLPVTNENAAIAAHDVSPDGQWIVYSSNVQGSQDLYVRPVSGGTPTPIATGPNQEVDPRWSPDGSEIAFHRGELDGRGMEVMVVPARGGTPLQLASAPLTWLVSWSPDGLALAFTSDQSGQLETWVVSRPAVGAPWGAARQLTSSVCQASAWAPDGSGVLCWEASDPRSPLTTSVGGEMVVISTSGEVQWRYDPASAGLTISNIHLDFSRDGSVIYAAGTHEDGRDGVWAIPVQGGDPTLVVAYDDPAITGLRWRSVRPDRLYLTVQQAESDIWVADVEVRR